jgi:hypothetical protein
MFFCLAWVCDIPLNRSKYTFFFCTKTIRVCYVVVFTNVNEFNR